MNKLLICFFRNCIICSFHPTLILPIMEAFWKLRKRWNLYVWEFYMPHSMECVNRKWFTIMYLLHIFIYIIEHIYLCCVYWKENRWHYSFVFLLSYLLIWLWTIKLIYKYRKIFLCSIHLSTIPRPSSWKCFHALLQLFHILVETFSIVWNAFASSPKLLCSMHCKL